MQSKAEKWKAFHAAAWREKGRGKALRGDIRAPAEFR